MDRQIFLNVFALAAIILILCSHEGEGLPHRLDEDFGALVIKPRHYLKRLNILQRMAKREVDGNGNNNTIRDGENDLDETPSSFAEDIDAQDLSSNSEVNLNVATEQRSIDENSIDYQAMRPSVEERSIKYNPPAEADKEDVCHVCRNMCAVM